MQKFGINQILDEQKVFIESSKQSLKAVSVLLNNGKKFVSVPVGHSVHLKESNENLKLVLTKIKYADHKWKICEDLKVLTTLLGQQGAYGKFPGFLCEWDGQQKVNTGKETLASKNLEKRTFCLQVLLILAPLHTKLAIMKEFVNTLPASGNCFQYLCSKCSHLSQARLKEDIFVRQYIKKWMLNENFPSSMKEIKKKAWVAFTNVVSKFLGKRKRTLTMWPLQKICWNIFC